VCVRRLCASFCVRAVSVRRQLHELVDFVYDASANQATREHVGRRAGELGERGLFEALPARLMDFHTSLGLDERTLRPLNLTELKDEL
jgi:hypothetical protein